MFVGVLCAEWPAAITAYTLGSVLLMVLLNYRYEATTSPLRPMPLADHLALTANVGQLGVAVCGIVCPMG